jgi:site-specific recombinase XerD
MNIDDTDSLLARFEAEYMAPNSISLPRRSQQMTLLRQLAARLDGPLTSLAAADVQSFMGAEIERGLHPNTVRREHGMIRSFVTWASAAGLIDPARSAELKSVRNPRGSSARSTPRPYKPSEIIELKRVLAETYPALPVTGRGSRALKRWCAGLPVLPPALYRHAMRVQLEAQIALALELGLRRIEIFHLTQAAMHPDNDDVVVLTAKQGPGQEVRRCVPYTAHARQCSQEWLDLRQLLMPEHDSLWLHLQRGARRSELVPMPFWKIKDALANLPGGWEWHRLRHTAATEWLRAGVSLEKVRVMMGHATIEQTLAYTQIIESDIGKAVGAAEADFNRRLGIAA